MEEIRDAIYYEQLARYARQLATRHEDALAARHLRETALKHERKARKLRRAEARSADGNHSRVRWAFWRD
ncbi:hypothetical protein [Novosphingobium pentaromativorans]|uniref:Uncharacterized protein n=1 Tax=Novosphingobium pentaromativorans US6-1 TaxID=1088721 RepID=G6E9R6_9SPHN|nr:hypothetical protein [Novosphingobium pentaromativorans]AIT80935.1 hypothetical protein JI59_14675 [Novosphingobium pentaromativorans US6-1]EHJ61990.1 hypothetical protein NSU_1087 [Novosphingobium pentaromativorans US6-1]